mmetsp:Transcript_29979/g.64203  ORF Transcript_29979/g.64203 Transcript_29979/m.64203 type:complete len:425 (-) Transcript_29979:2323-3597(-)|eukprot:CAMPEP_0201253356 /NCGR_PEP_ID=MMETSP0852-20130820/67405_1 /ASSEMBLY_ACC=CAM_ASM_000632 /TAXON_ID=183588 /ORGANISM="Pseudo-nitzschia fraudulenta, Strain WWA7" /LENGTH=424 /DNA_ID=CAMNT_0047553133 /DNA_START=55 /DNA_END=1329 /DNA_ORIENTATION=+
MRTNRNDGSQRRILGVGLLLVAAEFCASSLAFATPSFPSPQASSVTSPWPSTSPPSLLWFRSTGSSHRSVLLLGSSSDDEDFGDDAGDSSFEDRFENVAAAVIVPGFLTGADDFEPMCRTLTEKGIPTVAVPMPNWHWLPCLGGRSARPILERIDFTVRHLVANLEDEDRPIVADNAIYNIPSYRYSLWDCWKDFRNNPGGALEVGGSSRVEDYPVVEPRGDFPLPKEKATPDPSSSSSPKKIALIGHSAGGWIARVYLSGSSYGGRAYGGSRYVHSLVTLGTPHADAPGPAFDGIQWINQEQHESCRLSSSPGVRSLGVAGTGFAGGDWGDLTLGAYGFCCPEGTDGTRYDGDGVTPVFSSLSMPGAESMVLDGVTHFCWSDVFGGDLVAPELTEDHKNGRPWYGSSEQIDSWGAFIKDACRK